jgi:hypothetical protein
MGLRIHTPMSAIQTRNCSNQDVKLNFTKAFDTIEHNSITERMQQLRFSNQWLNCDGNKSLYLVFVGVIFFSQHLELLLEQLGQHLGLLFEQLGQQHLDCFC